jgi:hypothetical protein
MDFSRVAKGEHVKTIRPPMTPLLDLDVAKRDLSPYREQIQNMMKEAMALTVDSEESNAMAVELGIRAKKLNKIVEAEKKRITEVPSDFVKAVRNFCKEFFQDTLKRIEEITKQKVKVYQDILKLERRKAEETAKKAIEDLQKKIDKEAKKAGVEAPQIDTPVISQAPKVTRTDSGSAYIRKKWVFEIIDLKKLPDQYFIPASPDEAAIQKAINAGIRQIPGVRIYQETKTIFRS